MSPINFTKEGIEVKPGQVWLDLDKRNPLERKVRVRLVKDGVAVCSIIVGGFPGRDTKLAVRRMHKCATGWAQIPDGAA